MRRDCVKYISLLTIVLKKYSDTFLIGSVKVLRKRASDVTRGAWASRIIDACFSWHSSAHCWSLYRVPDALTSAARHVARPLGPLLYLIHRVKACFRLLALCGSPQVGPLPLR